MIAIDTNIILRYVLNDDLRLSEIATELIEQRGCYMPLLAFTETGYVLRSLYQAPDTQLLSLMRSVMAQPRVVVEKEARLTLALDGFAQGIDWFDAMLWASCPEDATLLTFDRKFAKKAGRMEWQPAVQSVFP